MATKRQLQAQATKKKLLKTAMGLIEEHGLDAVSIKDITSACGVAAGTFYKYFKSKDELTIYFSNRIHEEIGQLIDDSEDISALELLRQMLLRWKAWYDSSDPKLAARTSIVYANMYISGEQHPSRNDARFEEDTFRLCLEKAVAQGLLRDDTPVDFLSALLAMNIHGMMTFYSNGHDRETIDRWWEQYMNYIFRELLATYRMDGHDD